MARTLDTLIAALPWRRPKPQALVLVATTRGTVAVPADRLRDTLRRP